MRLVDFQILKHNLARIVSENEKPGTKPGLFDADVRHPHRNPSSRRMQDAEA